jgi:hypothetical protein
LQREVDESRENEKKLRADSPAMSDYVLKCSKRNRGKELIGA